MVLLILTGCFETHGQEEEHPLQTGTGFIRTRETFDPDRLHTWFRNHMKDQVSEGVSLKGR